MKKAQILSALALAFAMGIAVIPTASTYAFVNYPNTATQAEKDAITADYNAALTAYGELDKADAYATLYGDIEGENGLRKALQDAAKTLTNSYNTDSITDFSKVDINNAIDQINALTNGAAGGLYEKNGDIYVNMNAGSNTKQDLIQNLPKLNRVSDLKGAYSAVKALETAVNQSLTTLNTNYDATKTPVASVKTNLGNINDDIQAFWTAFTGAFGTTVFTTAPSDYALNDLKPVSEDAYDALVNSEAWIEAGKDTKAGRAIQYELLINAAAKLPKYNVVKGLVDAKENFDKIGSTTQSVSPSEARNYIVAFNTAIKNYRDGKTDGTGEGTNKPGEGDNNGGNKAPDTGILANAEGNASTTVAMVAGIATALTAAGAGVVAYRNARRSSRK